MILYVSVSVHHKILQSSMLDISHRMRHNPVIFQASYTGCSYQTSGEVFLDELNTCNQKYLYPQLNFTEIMVRYVVKDDNFCTFIDY